MFNEFGIPMSDAEMNMLPPGQNKPHQKMMAEAGVESGIWNVVGAVAGIGLGLIILSIFI